MLVNDVKEVKKWCFARVSIVKNCVNAILIMFLVALAAVPSSSTALEGTLDEVL